MLKLLKKIFFAVIGLVILIGLCAQFALFYSEQIDLVDGEGIPNCTSDFDSKYSTQIENSRLILKSMMKVCDLPALSVAVSKNSKLIWSEAFGFSNLESKSPACPKSIFRIGSVSKTLTAVAFVKLVEEKKLDLFEDIRIILPEYPDKGFSITPIQLATHRAGVRPYNDDMEAITTMHFNSSIESLDRFKSDPLVFEPGTDFQYSNYGYVLLSAVMEKACQKNFVSIMEEKLFAPLMMKSTIPELNDSSLIDVCTFYDNETPYSLDGQIHKSPFIDHSSKLASGGFLSTAEDLIRLADALDGDFLSQESVALMFKSYSSQLILHYGIGWMMVHDPYLRKSYFHFGAGSGATSVLVKFPYYDVDIVILSNLGHAKFPYGHLMPFINEFLPRPVHWLFYFIDFIVLFFLIRIVKRRFFRPRVIS